MRCIGKNNPSKAIGDAIWEGLVYAMKSHWNERLDFSKPAWVITYNQEAETFDNLGQAMKRMHDLVHHSDYDCALSIGGWNECGEIEQCDGDPIFITEDTPEPEKQECYE